MVNVLKNFKRFVVLAAFDQKLWALRKEAQPSGERQANLHEYDSINK